jgi:hypothetical protein
VEPGQFDTVLVNDSIDETYNNVLRCLREWFPFLNM